MKHLVDYKLFESESVSKFFGYNPNTINDIVDDITQDLKDEGFKIILNKTQKPTTLRGEQGSTITQFKISIKKRPSLNQMRTFNWYEISDRVEQLISTICEYTENEFRYSITARLYDQHWWYGSREFATTTDLLNKIAMKLSSNKFSEITSLDIEFYK